jgi:signal peptidase
MRVSPAVSAARFGHGLRSGGSTLLGGVRGALVAGAVGLVLWSVAPVVFGWTTTVVVSGSMAPAIQAGDVVAVAPVAREEAGRLAPGTVILIDDPSRPGMRLLHRLVEYDDSGRMITKGDANAVADSTPVPVENLSGVARLRVPMVGRPMLWLQQGQYVPVAALGTLLGIVVLWRPAAGARAGHDGRHGRRGRHRRRR